MIDDIAFKYKNQLVQMLNYPYAYFLICYKLCLRLLLLSNFKVFKQYKRLISQFHMLQTVTCVASLS